MSEMLLLLTLPVLAGPFLLGLAVYLILNTLPGLRHYPTLRQRLDALDEARYRWATAATAPVQTRSPIEAVIAPLIEDGGRLIQSLLTLIGLESGGQLALQLLLVNPGTTVASFTGRRLAWAIAGFCLLPLLNLLRLTGPGWGDWPWPAFFGLALIGAQLPRWELDRQLRQRRQRIGQELPRVMRSLCIALEGGRTMPEALEHVSHQTGVVGGELRWAYQQQRDGLYATLAQALRALAERNAVPELTSLVTILIQSLDRGLSATVVLRKQVELINGRRQAELQASSGRRRQAMILPLILLVIPILLLVILAPAAARVIQIVAGGAP